MPQNPTIPRPYPSTTADAEQIKATKPLISFKLPDGSDSRPYPETMPDEEIIAALRQEWAEKQSGPPSRAQGAGPLGQGMGNRGPAPQGAPVAQGQATADLGRTGQGTAQEMLGNLLTAGSVGMSLVPGPGWAPTAARVLGGGGLSVARDAMEGGLPAALDTAGIEGIIAGITEPLARTSLVNAVKRAGYVTGPYSTAAKKGPKVYHRQAEAIAREFERSGLKPGGFSANVEKTREEAYSAIQNRLRELDVLSGQPGGKKLNLPQELLSGGERYLDEVNPVALRGVATERAGINELSDIVADNMVRGSSKVLPKIEQGKQALQDSLRVALEARSPNSSTLLRPNQMRFSKQVMGTDPFNALPSEAYPIAQNMRRGIKKQLGEMAANQQVNPEGQSAMLRSIHNQLTDAIDRTDPAGKITDLRKRYSDIKQLEAFNKAVRRDPSVLPMRGAFGATVAAALGGLPSAGMGSLLAIAGLEPSSIFTATGPVPKAIGKYAPAVLRSLRFGSGSEE